MNTKTLLSLSLSLVFTTSAVFAGEEVDLADKACSAVAGQMKNLSHATWVTMPTTDLYDETIIFEDGSQVLLSTQTDSIQEYVKSLFDKNYSVYVCVNAGGDIAPIYKRVKGDADGTIEVEDVNGKFERKSVTTKYNSSIENATLKTDSGEMITPDKCTVTQETANKPSIVEHHISARAIDGGCRAGTAMPYGDHRANISAYKNGILIDSFWVHFDKPL